MKLKMEIRSLKERISACLGYDESSELDILRQSDVRLHSDVAFRRYLEGTLSLSNNLKQWGFNFLHKGHKIIHINKVELKRWKEERGDWYLQFGVSQPGTLSLKYVSPENGCLQWKPTQTADEDLIRVFTKKYIKDLNNRSYVNGIIENCLLRRKENNVIVRIANNTIWERRIQKGFSVDSSPGIQDETPQTLEQLHKNENYMNMLEYLLEMDNQGVPWPRTSTKQALVAKLNPGYPNLDLKSLIGKMASQTPDTPIEDVFEAIRAIGRADVLHKLREQFTSEHEPIRRGFGRYRTKSLDVGILSSPQEAGEYDDAVSRGHSATDSDTKAFPVFDSQPPASMTEEQNLRKNVEHANMPTPEQDTQSPELTELRNLEKNRQLLENVSSQAECPNPGYPLTNEAVTQQQAQTASSEAGGASNPGYPLTTDLVQLQVTLNLNGDAQNLTCGNRDNPGYPQTRSAVGDTGADS